MPSRPLKAIRRAVVHFIELPSGPKPETTTDIRNRVCLTEGYSDLTFHYIVFDEDRWESGRPEVTSAVREIHPRESLSILTLVRSIPWDLVAYLKQTYGDIELVYDPQANPETIDSLPPPE